MRRFHLVELEDLPWFPSLLRGYMLDFLRFLLRASGFYRPAATIIADILRKRNDPRILELCSGSGGPMIDLCHDLKALGVNPHITLSDLYPNTQAFEEVKRTSPEHFDYRSTPTDALHVPSTLLGLRIMFSALHHFRPQEVQTIFQSAAASGQPIAFFDSGDRGLFAVIFYVVIPQPLLYPFVTPFLKPFRWSRLLFTYVIPILPLLQVFDGVVSMLRFHSLEELQVMADGVNTGESYRFTVGQITRYGTKLNYVVGTPTV